MPELPRVAGTAFALRDPIPWADLSAIVGAAEAAGYSALLLPEIRGRDAFVTLSALAGETEEVLLGTGVVPMRSRSLLLTAMAAATVHERSGGRLLLGIGTGDAGVGALDELRETVLGLRTLLAGDAVERDGGRLRLSLVPRSPVPIWVSALGPRAMRLAGELADGVILNWCTVERVAFARDRIAEGAAATGRDPAGITLAVYVRAWVGEDGDEAMVALKADAGRYASVPTYGRQLRHAGLGDLATAAAEAHRSGRPGDVPEALVRAVCAVGEAAPARLEAYRTAGADLPVVYPVPVGEPSVSIERTLLALAPG